MRQLSYLTKGCHHIVHGHAATLLARSLLLTNEFIKVSGGYVVICQLQEG